MPDAPRPFSRFLPESRIAAREWLFECALPLWWESGADHRTGGFHEMLDPRGRPVGSPSRLRVQARQAFVYARAGALGWTGPWQQAMRHGLSFMLTRYRRPDCLFRSTLDASDTHVDLYDQAFVLLALAHGWRAQPHEDGWRAIAVDLMDRLDTHWRVDLGANHAYATPRTASTGFANAGVAAVNYSNPLMHLLEAVLAWVVADPHGSAIFRAAARTLVRLALERLIQPAASSSTGAPSAPARRRSAHGSTPHRPESLAAIGERFTDAWIAADDVVEPGHQFEWAYLLHEAEAVLQEPMLEAWPAAQRLAAFGRHCGIDCRRDVAVFSVDRTGTPRDRRARLWGQTERLRTALVLATRTGDRDAATIVDDEHEAIRAFASLQRFLDVPKKGLWHEWMTASGEFIPAPSPASSLYHLMTGLERLLTVAPGLDCADRAPFERA